MVVALLLEQQVLLPMAVLVESVVVEAAARIIMMEAPVAVPQEMLVELELTVILAEPVGLIPVVAEVVQVHRTTRKELLVLVVRV